MRVLLMNHFPLQGSDSGVYTVNIARALVRKGHEVCIIMPENEVLAEIDVDVYKRQAHMQHSGSYMWPRVSTHT